MFFLHYKDILSKCLRIRTFFTAVHQCLLTYLHSLKLVLSFNTPQFLLISFLNCVFSLLSIFSLSLMQLILNSLQTSEYPVITITRLCVIYVITDLFAISISEIATLINKSFESKFTLFLSEQILAKTQSLSTLDFETPETFNLIQRAQDSAAPQILPLVATTYQVVQSLIMLLGSFFVASTCYINDKLLIFIIIALLVITVLNVLKSIAFGKKRYAVFRKRTSESRMAYYCQKILSRESSIKDIKIFNTFHYFFDKYDQIKLKHYKQDLHIYTLSTVFTLFFSFIDELLTGSLFIISVIKAIEGKLLIGNVATLIKSITNIKTNLAKFCSQMAGLYNGAQYASDFFEFLDYKSCDSIHGTLKVDHIDTITFDNISFRYPKSNRQILKNLSFTLQSGKSYAIIGKNGSGKSTLIKLIMGLYGKIDGNLYVNGIPLSMLDTSTYHHRFSALFQEFPHYELSIHDNITISDLTVSSNSNRIKELLLEFGLNYYPFNNSNNILGYLYNDGIQLSGGEWLKIALCRVLYPTDRDVLILDEPLSALDQTATAAIYNAFSKSSHKIKIIIVHRLPEITSWVDEIIYIEDSHAYIGKHSDLYQNNPNYKKYFDTLRE